MAAEANPNYDAVDQAAAGGLPQLDYSTWFNQIFWLVLVFAALYICLLYTSDAADDLPRVVPVRCRRLHHNN